MIVVKGGGLVVIATWRIDRFIYFGFFVNIFYLILELILINDDDEVKWNEMKDWDNNNKNIFASNIIKR